MPDFEIVTRADFCDLTFLLEIRHLARFPDYLVCIPGERNDAPENANLLEMLSSGLPAKVLVQTDDLLDDASIGTGRFAFGVRSARLATAAMGLGGMFVLQSPSADLHALRSQVARGVGCRGPALFSVFTGTPAGASRLPPYLSAAAAWQARAFPAFSYDAAAGANWAERFSLAAGGRLAGAQRGRGGATCALPAGGRCRRRAAAGDRRCAADACHAPLPAAVAPPAGAWRGA